MKIIDKHSDYMIGREFVKKNPIIVVAIEYKKEECGKSIESYIVHNKDNKFDKWPIPFKVFNDTYIVKYEKFNQNLDIKENLKNE